MRQNAFDIQAQPGPAGSLQRLSRPITGLGENPKKDKG